MAQDYHIIEKINKQLDEIKSKVDDYNETYDVEQMLHLEPVILKIAEDCKERSFLVEMNNEIFFDNYGQVLMSDYTGDISEFNTDQRFIFQELKIKAQQAKLDKVIDFLKEKFKISDEDATDIFF